MGGADIMRATGQTFRTILQALLHLSEGQDVVIVCINRMEAARTMRQAHEIMVTNRIDLHPTYLAGLEGMRLHTTHFRCITAKDLPLHGENPVILNDVTYRGE